MSLHAFSCLSVDTDSVAAAEELAGLLEKGFEGHPLKAVLVGATMNHEQDDLLRALRAYMPADVALLGCSVQGMVCDDAVKEGGFAAACMGFGGDGLEVVPVIEHDFEVDTREKGRRMGERLRERFGRDPKVVILMWDPLCGADLDALLAGIREKVACPLIGGGAGQPWGRMVRTMQYWEGQVMEHAALAIGLDGPFAAEIGMSHGTSPTSAELTLTRSEGNRLLEIDGAPALDSWREVTGCTDEQVNDQDYGSNWAIGVKRTYQDAEGAECTESFVRAAFGFDLETGSILVGAAIPQGSRVVFHHRTVPTVVDGAAAMGRDLVRRIGGRRPWAVLGFECAARTSPFLGAQVTADENRMLRRAVAPATPWFGMMAWGEVAPVGGVATFHNYTYPLLVLCD